MCVCVCVGWGGGWKLCYGRVHGQIHLAAQFTSGVLCVCVFVWGGVGAESSVMVEFMVKFIWQHNLPVGFKMPPGRVDFWCSKGKKWGPSCNSKTKSQRSEPKWLGKYLITPNFWAKFQPNRLTTTFGPWNTFSDSLKRPRPLFGPESLTIFFCF